MKTSAVLVAALSAGSALASAVVQRATSLPAVYTHGNAFWTANTTRFYMRGVDYQPGGSSNLTDPLADTSACQRDIPYFKSLGVNTVRIYTVDNTANHDTCMQALADAGIYLALDVNTPYYSLNRKDNDSIHRSYNDVYLQSVFATVDAFAQYDNTLLYYSGNEVINDNATTFAAPYVKAVTRDIKAYIKARSYRSIPVGYSAADVSDNRYQMAQYMNCGSNDVRSDFFAFNDYSWCDPSSYTISGWDQKVALFGNYSQPIFLSEFGCNTNTRKFEEIAALYSTQMTPVYSGGLVYEYSQEEANYGLVDISGSSVSERDDFTALVAAYKKTAAPSGDGGYKSSGSASTCPAAAANWKVTNDQIPTIPAGAVQYMSKGAGTGPGNSGQTGSQNAGTASTGTVNLGTSSSSSSSGSSTTSKAAAASVRAPEFGFAPLVAVAAVLVSTLAGGAGFLI